MERVTESRTAICMAQEGESGIITGNMPIRSQVLDWQGEEIGKAA
jgi:IMP dehydrogenase/GMP reductase